MLNTHQQWILLHKWITLIISKHSCSFVFTGVCLPHTLVRMKSELPSISSIQIKFRAVGRSRNLIPVSICDNSSVGPSIRRIRNSWRFSTTNMIQVCSNFWLAQKYQKYLSRWNPNHHISHNFRSNSCQTKTRKRPSSPKVDGIVPRARSMST